VLIYPIFEARNCLAGKKLPANLVEKRKVMNTGMEAVITALLSGADSTLTQKVLIQLLREGEADWPAIYEEIAKDLIMHEDYSETAKVTELVAAYYPGVRAAKWIRVLGEVLGRDRLPGAQCQGIQGVVLGIPKIALWIDKNWGPRAETFGNEFISVMAGMITSQSQLMKLGYSDEPSEPFKRDLSAVIKGWVRGQEGYQGYRLTNAYELMTKVSNCTHKLSGLGELMLNEFAFGLFSPVDPLEKAKMLAGFYDRFRPPDESITQPSR
jgi:hypothetical protein